MRKVYRFNDGGKLVGVGFGVFGSSFGAFGLWSSWPDILGAFICIGFIVWFVGFGVYMLLSYLNEAIILEDGVLIRIGVTGRETCRIPVAEIHRFNRIKKNDSYSVYEVAGAGCVFTLSTMVPNSSDLFMLIREQVEGGSAT